MKPTADSFAQYPLCQTVRARQVIVSLISHAMSSTLASGMSCSDLGTL